MNHLLFFASPGDIFRDTGIYLVSGIFLGLMHFLIWCVARHTADIKFWRIGVFCLPVGCAIFFGTAMGGGIGIMTGPILGCLCAWFILGYLFDLETWQRVALTAISAPAAVASLFAGIWLRGLILTNFK